MTRKAWRELSPTARRWIVLTGTVEAVLKIAALIDLARRPAAQVRGSKFRWAVAIIVVNSGGLLPIVYFRRGRRKQPTAR